MATNDAMLGPMEINDSLTKPFASFFPIMIISTVDYVSFVKPGRLLMMRCAALELEDMTSFTSNRASPLLPSLFNKSILSIWFPTNDYGAKRFWAADSAFGRFDVLTAGSFSCFSLFFLLIRLYSLSGLHNLLQPGSLAAGLRENGKRMRK